MHPPPVLKKEIHLLQHHWLEFGQEWNSLERMDISSQRNQRNGYSGHCESVLIYSFSWNPSQLPAGGNSFAEIRWMRTICFPHIQHNSDLFLFHWLHLLLSTRGWHLLLTQQRKEEKTKPSTNNWSPMKNLYKVLSATCQIELQLVWLRCVLMKTTKKHNCLSRCVSLEIYAAQNIICLHYCVCECTFPPFSQQQGYVLSALHCVGKVQTTHLEQPCSHSSMDTQDGLVSNWSAEGTAGRRWCLYSGWTQGGQCICSTSGRCHAASVYCFFFLLSRNK